MESGPAEAGRYPFVQLKPDATLRPAEAGRHKRLRGEPIRRSSDSSIQRFVDPAIR
jgi:hypothetical protein